MKRSPLVTDHFTHLDPSGLDLALPELSRIEVFGTGAEIETLPEYRRDKGGPRCSVGDVWISRNTGALHILREARSIYHWTVVSLLDFDKVSRLRIMARVNWDPHLREVVVRRARGRAR